MKVLCKQQEFNKNFEEVCTWMFFLPRARLDLSYSNLIGKDPDAGKDWRWEEKAATEDKMVGRHHRLHGHEFEQAPGVGDSQWSLACCSPWRGKESDTTEWLNWYWLTDDESTLRASQVALVVKNPPADAVLSRSVKSNSLRPHELQPTSSVNGDFPGKNTGVGCYAGDIRDEGLIPGSGISPGGGHGNPLQYSCLENSTDRGAWRATVHLVSKESDNWSNLAHTQNPLVTGTLRESQHIHVALF